MSLSQGILRGRRLVELLRRPVLTLPRSAIHPPRRSLPPHPPHPTGNAGGGAGRRAAGAAGRPGDVHPADRGPAGRPGGGGVQRRERLGEVTDNRCCRLYAAPPLAPVDFLTFFHRCALHSSVHTAVGSLTRKKDL